MALIKCDECASQVSDTAKTCPKCGAKVKQPMSRITIGIIGLLLIFGLKSLFTDDEKQSSYNKNAPSKSLEQLETEKKKEENFQLVVKGAKILKASMKNPDSFRLISAVMMDDSSICYEYRGANSFNAVVPERYVVNKTIGSNKPEHWNKFCGGKKGIDFSSARQAL